MDYLIVDVEAMLLKKGKTNTDLIRATGHTPANISKIRNGKIKAIRFKTLLDICVELDCQPGDLIKRVTETELEQLVLERARQNIASIAKNANSNNMIPTTVHVVDLSDE